MAESAGTVVRGLGAESVAATGRGTGLGVAAGDGVDRVRRLWQGPFRTASPQAAQVGLQGVPEQAPPEGRRRASPGAKPRADAAPARRESTPGDRRGGVGKQHPKWVRAAITGAAAIRCPWNRVAPIPRPPPGTRRCRVIPPTDCRGLDSARTHRPRRCKSSSTLMPWCRETLFKMLDSVFALIGL